MKTRDAIFGHIKEAAKALGINENDLEDRGYEKGYELVGHKKTGAILAKKNIRNGKMIVYKERMTKDGASGSRIDSFNIGADKYELIGWVHDNHYFSITIYKNNDEIKSWEFYNKKEMSQYLAKAKAEFGMLKKSFGSKVKDAKVKDGASTAVKANLALVFNEHIYSKNARGISDAKADALLKKFISQGGSEKEYFEILDKVHKMHERKVKDGKSMKDIRRELKTYNTGYLEKLSGIKGGSREEMIRKIAAERYKNEGKTKDAFGFNEIVREFENGSVEKAKKMLSELESKYKNDKDVMNTIAKVKNTYLKTKDSKARTLDWTIIHRGDLASFDQNEYCFTVEYFNQYAIGLTGANRILTLYVKSKDKGWATLADAKAAAQSRGFKNYRKKGRQDEGYGSVGAEQMTVRFAKIRNYESIVAKSSYSSWLSVQTFDAKAKDSELYYRVSTSKGRHILIHASSANEAKKLVSPYLIHDEKITNVSVKSSSEISSKDKVLKKITRRNDSMSHKKSKDSIDNTYWAGKGKYQKAVKAFENNDLEKYGVPKSLINKAKTWGHKYYRYYNDGDVPFPGFPNGNKLWKLRTSKYQGDKDQYEKITNQIEEQLESKINEIFGEIDKYINNKTNSHDANPKEFRFNIKCGADMKKFAVKANSHSEALDVVKKEAIKYKAECIKSRFDGNKLSTRDRKK